MKQDIILLIMALIQVESGNRDDIIGDNGKAYGCLQIHAGYVQDVAHHSGIPYAHEDAFNRDLAIDIFKIYMSIYANKYRLQREPTFEDIARIHNGGPDGWQKDSTKLYWKKVKKYLD